MDKHIWVAKADLWHMGAFYTKGSSLPPMTEDEVKYLRMADTVEKASAPVARRTRTRRMPDPSPVEETANVELGD